MIKVTREEFYSYVGPLNVHPRPEVDVTYWEMQDGSRKLIGRSTPGWKNPGDRKSYEVAEEIFYSRKAKQ